MKTVQRLAVCIEAREKTKRALDLISNCFMNMDGAAQLIDAAAGLEQAVFHCRLIADDIRREWGEQLKNLPAADRILERVRDMKAAGASDSEVFSKVLGPYFAQVSLPLPQFSPVNVLVHPANPAGAPSLCSAKPVTKPAAQSSATVTGKLLPGPAKDTRRPRRKRSVSRERGLALFAELDREIEAARRERIEKRDDVD